MVSNYMKMQNDLHLWATDLESRLKEALEGKVLTVDSVIDANIALYHKKFEEHIKQLMSNIAKCFRDHEMSAK
eukprot:9279092-Lingulodinium_polyedra.AAC.1